MKTKQKPILKTISNIIANITPLDEMEAGHINDALEWIETAESIFRIKKPDIPNKHLVSYCVLFDEDAKKILLADHKLANLWLATGGHVDINEHPEAAARRECKEELGIEAELWTNAPIFLTSTLTTGKAASHTDISLWYIFKGDHKIKYKFEEREFNEIKWFSFDEIPYDKADIHMERFISKLQDINLK